MSTLGRAQVKGGGLTWLVSGQRLEAGPGGPGSALWTAGALVEKSVGFVASQHAT